jgi:hypothetical protein
MVLRPYGYTAAGTALVISRYTVMAASGQTSAQIAQPVQPSLKVWAGWYPWVSALFVQFEHILRTGADT